MFGALVKNFFVPPQREDQELWCALFQSNKSHRSPLVVSSGVVAMVSKTGSLFDAQVRSQMVYNEEGKISVALMTVDRVVPRLSMESLPPFRPVIEYPKRFGAMVHRSLVARPVPPPSYKNARTWMSPNDSLYH